MSEVPDQDNSTSFMMNMKSKLTTPIDIENCGDLAMVVEPSRVDAMAKEAPQLSCTYTGGETYSEWLKPFGAEWTLRGIVQAKTESEAKAILKNWIHKAWAEEVVDDMIEGMRKAMRIDALWWLEELWQPRQIHQRTEWERQGLDNRCPNQDSGEHHQDCDNRISRQRVHQ